MSTKLISFERGRFGTFICKYHNGKFIGELAIVDDGYYHYWPSNNGGFWNAAPMREIADKLDELNADWDSNIKEYFDGL